MVLPAAVKQVGNQLLVQGSQTGTTSTLQTHGIIAPQGQKDLQVNRDLHHLPQLRVLRHEVQ